MLVAALYNTLLSRSLGRHEIFVYGQNRWAPGLPASVRVIIVRRGDQRPVAEVPVRLVLFRPRAEYVELASGRTNEAGTLDTTFTVPDGEGQAQLVIVAEGRKQVDRPVLLVPAYRIHLSTDRPAYRAGQNVRLQVWVARAGTGQPASERTVSVRVFAPDGTPVVARPLRTDAHGRAATQVGLAPTAPAGTYRFRVTVGPSTVQTVLPVVAAPAPPFPAWLSEVTRFAVPGGLVRGRVAAADRLGSALRGARARVWLENAAGRTVSWSSGQLDARGEMTFGLPAPHADKPATLRLLAEVTDSRLQVARALQTVALTPEPIQLAAVPEAGTLVPGVRNQLFLVARYPDGSPAAATLRYTLQGRRGTVQTGPLGVAAVTFTPKGEAPSLTVTATDRFGRTGSYQANLALATQSPTEWRLRDRYRALTGRPRRDPPPPILLRPDQAFYAAGGLLRLEAFSPGADGPLYVDGFVDGQTAFTRTLQLRDGHGVLEIRLPEGIHGRLWLRAYRLGPWGDAVRAARAVFVRPNGVAQASLRLGRPAYRPGQEGHLTLNSEQPLSAVVVLSRTLAGKAVVEPPLVGPASLMAPTRPGAPRGEDSPAPEASVEQKQTAAFAALALLPPPDGWSLQEDVWARNQAQLRQRQAQSWAWLRWAVLALLGGLWLLALVTRAFSHAPANGEESGRAAASPLRFAAAATLVALVATFLFRLGREPAPKSVSATAQVIAALQKEQEKQTTSAVRRLPLLPHPVSRSIPVPEVAFWKTDLSTGAEGHVTTRFTAPAAPGEWWLTAVGVTSDGTVARSTTPLPVTATVLAEVEAPPQVRAGDVASVTVRVRNPLAVPQPIRWKLMVGPGLFMVGEPVHAATIPAGAALTRHLRVGVIDRPGLAPLTVRVSGQHDTLTFRRELEIRAATDEATRTYAGQLAQETSHQIHLTGAAREATLSLQGSPAELAATRLAELPRAPLAGAINQAAVLDIARLALPAGQSSRALAILTLERGLQELLAYRDRQGGFAAFPGGEPDVPSTLYAAAVLESLKEYLPAAGPLARAARVWVRSQQRADGTWPMGRGSSELAAAFAAFCLGPRDPAIQSARRRYRSLQSDDPYLLALAALGFGSPSGPDEASADRLAALAAATPAGRRWVAAGTTVQGLAGEASAAETTALVLAALTPGGAHQRRVAEGLSFLAATRQPGGGWGSPFGTAMALRAFAAAAPVATKPGTVLVQVNGRPYGRLSAAAPTLDLRDLLAPGANTVTLLPEGNGPLYYELNVTSSGLTSAASPGAPTLRATYSPRVVGSREVVRFSARLAAEDSGLLCLEVPIPAGFRPVRQDLERLVAQGEAVAMQAEARLIRLFVAAAAGRQSHRLSFRLVPPGQGSVLAPAPCAYPVAAPAARAYGEAVRLTVPPG